MQAFSQCVAQRYRTADVVGRGGMGLIVAAQDLRLGQRVALKILLPEIAEMPGVIERFRGEAEVLRRLRGDGFVRFYDAGMDAGATAYIAMELLEGDDLGELLSRTGPLAVAEVIDIGCDLCAAMREAHELGVVHRDLKPSNLFIDRLPANARRLKVLDFGISTFRDAPAPAIAPGTLLGSPHYMSPEQFANTPVDCRSDIWAIGVLLYQLLTHRLPFDGDSLRLIADRGATESPLPLHDRKVAGELLLVLDATVRRCLEKEPAARFQNVAELGTALGNLRQFHDVAAVGSLSSDWRRDGRAFATTMRNRRWGGTLPCAGRAC